MRDQAETMLVRRPELPAGVSAVDQAGVRHAAEYLRSQGAGRVWLFGSLAGGRRPTVHSDFDFAVEGLPGERFLGCLGHLLQVLPRSVDLVELESCSRFLRERILTEGILLTE